MCLRSTLLVVRTQNYPQTQNIQTKTGSSLKIRTMWEEIESRTLYYQVVLPANEKIQPAHIQVCLSLLKPFNHMELDVEVCFQPISKI